MSLPIPPAAANYYDLFSAFFIIGLVAGGTVVGYMVYYAYANRKNIGRREFKISRAHFRSRAREAVVLAMISLTILFTLSAISDRMAYDIQTPPDDPGALTVEVTAFQWAFEFTYPAYNITVVTDCRIPVNTQVIFNVTSIDVMHDFGLPQFKIKTDAIPGRYNIIWLSVPSLEGYNELTYQIKCYELCGVGHTVMDGNLIVMSEAAFIQWVNQTATSQRAG
jgi:cytochrome c oxidase subunit 2